jgi:hypothetical protein
MAAHASMPAHRRSHRSHHGAGVEFLATGRFPLALVGTTN